MSDFGARVNDTDRPTMEPKLRLDRLAKPVHGSSLKSLFSNLRDFLSERPVKIHGGAPEVFATSGFGGSLGENFRELFHAGPRGRVDSALLVKWENETGFWQNLRDLVAPPKRPPLQTTSQPIAVPEIWTKDTALPRAQALSITIHVLMLLVLLVFVPLLPELMSPGTTKASNAATRLEDISPYLPKLAPAAKKAGGGGGQHDQLPASKGRLPKFSWTQVSRPVVKPPEHAEIAVTPTVLGNPAIVPPNINAPNWGDPLGKTSNDSMGQGRGTGVGSGTGAGVGPGEGWNTGGGLPYAGTGGYGLPKCAYCPEPEFSMDAVKVKVQGVVLLGAVVTADGRVTDIHIAKGLGFGLDEKVIEMVRTWRLTPARGPDGKPAAVRMDIEVNYRLF